MQRLPQSRKAGALPGQLVLRALNRGFRVSNGRFQILHARPSRQELGGGRAGLVVDGLHALACEDNRLGGFLPLMFEAPDDVDQGFPSSEEGR